MQDVFREFIIWFAQFIVMSVSILLAVVVLVRGHRKTVEPAAPQQNSSLPESKAPHHA